MSTQGFLRRGRPMLGTLVEVGVAHDACALAAVTAAFEQILEVQAQLSRFEPHSDVSRFHALPAGGAMEVRPHAAVVLAAAQSLHDASGGMFDVSLGSGPDAWHIDAVTLQRKCASVRLDLGGIAKGHAVDRAVEGLIDAGCAAGWVNAGGDLRVFGDVRLPIVLRDEIVGGARAFATLSDGAFATSRFGADARQRAAAHRSVQAHASVAAPQCLWADALTKIVAISGDAQHPLLRHHGAQAWLH